MIFKSEEHLKKFLEPKLKAAVTEAENKIYAIIKKVLVQYYGEFTPDEYIRTNQLLNSLVKSRVKKTGSGYVAEVYFDAGALNYQTGPIEIQSTATTGRMGYATWGANEVLDTAMNGSHGGYVSGTPIWGASYQEFAVRFGTIYNLLLKELKAQGIPIR